jgi:hypothetical protein
MNKTNPNQKRIDQMRDKIRDIGMRKNINRYSTNAGDAIPKMQEEIRRLGGNPHINFQAMG